ncbi:MAG TPA: 3'-5' exonuclease [Gemmatimonadaceae bacterium]|nr:3'-5' exonuclease [Gemmatimonadaceae bacterium]
MPGGVTLGSTDSVLTDRAMEFLAAGPANAQALISHVCQLPGAPLNIAEHMAAALFAGHVRFARLTDGRWRLRDSQTLATPPTERPLHEEPFVVVDVETTGARAYGGDRVTEIGIVRVHRGVATTVFETLVNPERPIPPSITAVTSITASMVRHAPRFAEVCDQLLGALEGNVFVAHNARFDWRFLSMEVERASGRPLVGRTLCTVRMARQLVPELRRRNLGALAHYYGIEIVNRHRAGGDARATARVFLRLLEAARQRDCVSLDDLDGLLDARTSRKKRRRRRPALPHSVQDDTTA